jgi:hypothetical protein
MTTYLKMYLLLVRVMHMPDDTYFIIIEYIAHAQGKVVGIDFLCLLRGFEGEGHFPVAMGNQLKYSITGKAMTRQVILLTINAISLVVDTANNREKYRRVSSPVFGISLPQIFLTISILDALELGSLLRYNNRELFVL